MKLKTFSNPGFLEKIGRGMLARLLAQFEPEFAGLGLVLPAAALDDDTFYREVATMPKAPEQFVEALHGIETMATDDGRERLQQAAQAVRLPLEQPAEASHADFAAQVWLAQPELFNQKQEESRIVGLTSFEYYGSAKPPGQSAPFTRPEEATLQRMRADINSWLALQYSSEQRVIDLEVFEFDGEWLFLIRRGDACKRVPTVEGERVMMRHFRPARDLVVAYSPTRDELRLHGRSVREKRMIREVFGWRLFGDLRRFSARRHFTLEPLRTDGVDALTAPPGCGIERIVMTALEIHAEDEHDESRIWRADDCFALAEGMGISAVPEHGTLARAAFDIYFTGQRRPRAVHIRAGNQLRMSRHCDATAVHRWLTERGFRCAKRES